MPEVEHVIVGWSLAGAVIAKRMPPAQI